MYALNHSRLYDLYPLLTYTFTLGSLIQTWSINLCTWMKFVTIIKTITQHSSPAIDHRKNHLDLEMNHEPFYITPLAPSLFSKLKHAKSTRLTSALSSFIPITGSGALGNSSLALL